MSSEEDVFGHGGQLEQEHPEEVVDDKGPAAADPADAQSRTDVTVCDPHASGAFERPSERPAKSARRNMEYQMRTGRDYVAEAVSRLGSSLKRKDTNPQVRMELLRRRVAARAVAPADDAVPQRRGTKRGMGGGAWARTTPRPPTLAR